MVSGLFIYCLFLPGYRKFLETRDSSYPQSLEEYLVHTSSVGSERLSNLSKVMILTWYWPCERRKEQFLSTPTQLWSRAWVCLFWARQYYVAIKRTDSRTRLWVQIPVLHLLAMWPRTSHLTFPYLSFFICKIRKIHNGVCIIGLL